MNKKADYTIIGCKDEVEFVKLLGNQYLYEDIINSSIENLDPDNFLNKDEYYSRMADFQSLKFRYEKEFIQENSGAEFHWYFIQGIEAYTNGHYLPALLSLICGIEASLRSTLHLISDSPEDRLYVAENMNKQMIIKAKQKGLPISVLAFSDEHDFHEKITNGEKINLIKLRNDLMHGNIREFTEYFEDQRIFYPEHLLDPLVEIILISKKWIKELSEFRSTI
ncbi:hypothetical protein [Acinetobacter baumannii]|uniref:hypothetical protein n=1 Tax=Acinetobacter baumannii TaxID=470 RepID=UPI000E75D12A|nr:hypothetical protein [Acinetobacter baumannii]QBC46795.1 hypothetical protein C4X49_04715 [Acinetobacter baumannii]RJN65015.1 hypothetical protein D3X67_19860 [Acinetobacter baumannii]RKL59490.1 hypothetical protein CKN54_08715 [Acinetobacter baumannii]HEN9559782.1 hypothetical protein [Acinetobacter baumannii]